jgi:hypothetical protein
MKKVITVLFLFLNLIIISAQNGDYALKFNGINQYVNINYNSVFNVSKVTLEAWIFLESTNGTDINFVMGKGLEELEIHTGASGGYGLRFIPTEDLIYDTQSNVFESNKWYHIAFSYDPTATNNYVKCYINGVEKTLNKVGGTEGDAITQETVPLHIGNRGDNTYYFKGKIDEVRIWNTIRTQNEIKANMYKELSGNESGLVAYYKMSNGTGTNLTDNQTSNTNAGTLTNGTTWVASGCFAGCRNALNFDGTDDYVSVPYNSIFNVNKVTLEAWIYWTETDANEVDFVMGKGFEELEIHTGGASSNYGLRFIPTSGVYLDTPKDIFVSNKWYHVAFVYDPSISLAKGYINGAEVLLTNNGTNPITTNITGNVSDFSIGRRNTNMYYFKGHIDEVRVWNKVRTESEIRENMMKNLIGNENGLVAYYRFDNYDGSTLYDLTSNVLNGTLTNMDAATDWISSAAFNTWLGGESNAWTNAVNWSNGVPAETDNVGLYKWNLSNITTYDASQNSNFTTNSLFISSAANPTLPTTFTVNGSFVIDKDIDITGKTITLGTSGYLSEGNYSLYGTSGTISTTRNLGTLSSLTNIGGLGFEIKSTSNLGATTIIRGMEIQSTGGLSNPIGRYYDVSASGGAPFDVVFNYKDDEVTDNESNLSLFKSTNLGVNWSLLSTNRNTTNNTVSVTGLTSFSRFTLADEGSPLPVELQSFLATTKNKKVIITWQTATEINNYGFEIERAQVTEGKKGEFKKIGFVQGHGNSNTIIDYMFTDSEVKYGRYAYRLKQIDKDGKYNYSNIVETEINNVTNYNLSQNYPNPFNPVTKISYSLPKATNVTLKIYDMLGKEVITLVSEKQEIGIYNIEFNASNLSSGIYYYKLETEEFSQVKKMIVLK